MIRFLLLFLLFLQSSFTLFAQLSPADSIFFINRFTSIRYVNTNFYPGDFYINPAVNSLSNLYAAMDSTFLFKVQDMDSIQYLTTGDSLVHDAARNNAFLNYPNFLNETDPLVFLPFTFLNKQSKAYCFRHKCVNSSSTCKYAVILVPGSGVNQGWEITQGTGYHNLFCQVKNQCQNYGDVYTFIKPNEESRAIHWNNQKLENEYLNWYATSQNTYYGVNYLIEMIALIKHLKTKYDKVLLYGLSEGGYASILARMYEEPTAAMIAGGYSIRFDTLWVEKDILRSRFDYLVDSFNMVKVRDRLSTLSTQFLFSYGFGDPVIGMHDENQYHYTQNYFNLPNCSFFYDMYDHTFPPCNTIDTFSVRIGSIPQAKFTVHDSTKADTMWAKVAFCQPGHYGFDLYKGSTFVSHYSGVTDSILLPLTEKGYYYFIKGIADSSNVTGFCNDSIWSNFPTHIDDHFSTNHFVQVNNPFSEKLDIRLSESGPWLLEIYDMMGRPMYRSSSEMQPSVMIPCSSWPAGVYTLRVRHDAATESKVLKLLKTSFR